MTFPGRTHSTPPRGEGNVHPPRLRSFEGRYGRLFGDLPAAHDPDNEADSSLMDQIAAVMIEEPDDKLGENHEVPAGYTYLGQFIDHDITFDPTSQLDRRNDEDGLLNFRTPRFDLDSLYGSGPADEPFQYSGTDPAKLLITEVGAGFDMPRNGEDVALIGDPRNDENGIVSQLHVLFTRLHNTFVDQVRAATSGSAPTDEEVFKAAQRRTQWHYQWVVVHDFLPRIIGRDLHAQLLTNENDRDRVHLQHYRHKRNPYIPVEFSGAVYRFGHTQVRDAYSINNTFHRRLFDAAGDDFRGFQPLRPGWHASWPHFFDLDNAGPQLSRKVDSHLSPTLGNLPGHGGDNLASLNLRRGVALSLPDGASIAVKLKEAPLTSDEVAPAPADRVPLWFYILREAEHRADGKHLGPVGGRIVGETLLGLLRADPQSYYTHNLTAADDNVWKPTVQAATPQGMTMGDLIRFAGAAQRH